MLKYFNIFLYVLFLISCIRPNSCYEDKKGNSCNVGKNTGTCMPFLECKAVNSKHSIKDYPKCSVNNGKPLICCIDKKNGNVSKKVTVKDPITRRNIMKNGQKAWDKCLDYLRDVKFSCKGETQSNGVSDVLPIVKVKKISGGQNARETQFPHMALLGYYDGNNSITWNCGGSLISEMFILTAAHCTYDTNGRPVKHVALGILKRSDPQERWQRRTVQNIISYPKYKSPSQYHDIALLRMNKRVNFGPTVAPACLAISSPPHKNPTLKYKGFSVTGWGSLGVDNKIADVLQVAHLDKFDDKECRRKYPVHRHLLRGYDNKTQACFGKIGHTKDTCAGDSGGPLQIAGQASDCQYSIVAVTSYGNKCPSKRPGLYTKVVPYLDWIESIVWP